ncbi:MAG TPA: methyltransferase domain-containing protein [Acidimicrobiales bacterium]|nr:methyltransferase domain-containing protein [Acidimicrobiales bacterium]
MSALIDLMTGLSLTNDHGRGEWLAETAGVGPGDKVLDIGCGPGTALAAASRRGATAIGLDPSPTMLWLAARRNAGAILLAAGVDAIPLPCDSVTVAWASGSLHHWPDVDAGLAEVTRVLAPGGRLVIIERAGSGHRLIGAHAITPVRADGLVEKLTALGYSATTVERADIASRDMLLVRGDLVLTSSFDHDPVTHVLEEVTASVVGPVRGSGWSHRES